MPKMWMEVCGDLGNGQSEQNMQQLIQSKRCANKIFANKQLYLAMKSRLKPYHQFNLANRLVPSNNSALNQTTTPVTVSTEIKRPDLPKYLNSSMSGNSKFYVYRKSSTEDQSDSNHSCMGSSTHLSNFGSESSQPTYSNNARSVAQFSDLANGKAKINESMFEKRKVIGQPSKQTIGIIDHFRIPPSVTNSVQITSNHSGHIDAPTSPHINKSETFQFVNGTNNMQKVYPQHKIQSDLSINEGAESYSTRNMNKIKPSSRYQHVDDPEQEGSLSKNPSLPLLPTERIGISKQSSSSVQQVSSQNTELTIKISRLEKQILSFKQALQNWAIQEQKFCEEINKKQYQIKQLNLTKVNLKEELKLLQLKLTNEKEGKQRQQQQIKILSNLNQELKIKNEELAKKISLQKECLECARKKQEVMDDKIQSLLNLKMELDRYIKINRELEEKLEDEQHKIVELSFTQAQKDNELCLTKKNSFEEVETLKFQIKKIAAQNERLKTEMKIKQNQAENAKAQLLNQLTKKQKNIEQIRCELVDGVKNRLIADFAAWQIKLNDKLASFEQKIKQLGKKTNNLAGKIKQNKMNKQMDGKKWEIIQNIEQQCKIFLSQVAVSWETTKSESIIGQACSISERQRCRLEQLLFNLIVILNMSKKLASDYNKTSSSITQKNKQILSLEVKIDDERVEKLKQIINLEEQKNAALQLQEELQNNCKELKCAEEKLKQLQCLVEEESVCLSQTCEQLVKSRLALLSMKYREQEL